MNTLLMLLAIGLAGLLGWAILIAFADAMIRRQHEQHLSARDWQETVEAMRRMADQEGDA